MFYNGDVKHEPGAVVCRVAPSFVRFGTFQLPISRGAEEAPLTVAVADYVIKHHFPELEKQENKYLAMLEEVVDRTAHTVARWQLVGFVHGAPPLCAEPLLAPTSVASGTAVVTWRLACRRAEHGQHECAGADDRLRPVRLPGQV